MNVDLYVLRHGLAVKRGALEYPDDEQRPLTPKGIRRMARQVRGLNRLGLSLDLIIASPLPRAAETAKIVHRGLAEPGRLVTSDALAPAARPESLIGQIASSHSSAGSVMIVGHEPYLGRLVSVLVTGDEEPMIRLRKGSLCKLRLFAVRYARSGWIEWSMTPRQMAKLG